MRPSSRYSPILSIGLSVALVASSSGCGSKPAATPTLSGAGAGPTAPQPADGDAPSATPSLATPSTVATPNAAAGDSSGKPRMRKVTVFGMEREVPESFFEAQDLWEQAYQAHSAGDPERALDLIDEVLARLPAHSQAASYKARILKERGEPRAAIAALDVAIAANPGSEGLFLEQALLRLEIGEAAEALRGLETVLSWPGDHPQSAFARALAHAQLRDAASTLTSLDDAYAQDFRNLSQVEGEARFEFIRDEPRFRDFVRRLEEYRDDFRRQVAALEDPTAGLAVPTGERFPEAKTGFADEDLRRLLENNLRSNLRRVVTLDARALDGSPMALDAYRGKAVVAFFFGTWSPVSLAQLPLLQELHDSLGGQDVVVLLLANQKGLPPVDDPDGIREHLARAKVRLPCALVSDGKATEFGVFAYPTTVFIGRNGSAYLEAAGPLGSTSLRTYALRVRDGTDRDGPTIDAPSPTPATAGADAAVPGR